MRQPKIYKPKEFQYIRMKEIGDRLEGVYLFSMAPNLYHILTKDGPKCFHGCMELDFAMAQVQRGDEIRITYRCREQLTAGCKVVSIKKFDVSYADQEDETRTQTMAHLDNPSCSLPFTHVGPCRCE